MRISVECHGVLVEVCGAERELTLDAGTATVADALAALTAQVPTLHVHLPRAAVARGDELVGRDAAVVDGDRLALIPPVSGG